jgi:SAM-dependent methyltransferase
MDYEQFHKKNKDIQVRIINDHDYTYQSLIRLTSRHFLDKGSVIDVGCGVGTIDFYLANKGFEVLGIDVSKRAIKLALSSKEKLGLSSVQFVECPIERCTSYDLFDYFICSEVLEHLNDPLSVLQSICDRLHPGGIGIVSVPSLNAPLYRLGKLGKFDKDVGHLRRYSVSSLKKILEESGFRIIETVKTEGLLRNLFYTHEKLGFSVKFVRFPITLGVNLVDNLLVALFGESNIYMVVTKK